jgi:hypothetical protein
LIVLLLMVLLSPVSHISAAARPHLLLFQSSQTSANTRAGTRPGEADAGRMPVLVLP